MSKPMPKYWTTMIDPAKTVGQVQEKLVAYGVKMVQIEYDQGLPVALSFKIEMNIGDGPPVDVPVRLVPNMNSIFLRLQGARQYRTRRNREDADWRQAYRIAWRQLKDWLILSLEMTDLGVRDLQDIFFGDIVVSSGVRFADAFVEDPTRFLSSQAPLLITAEVEVEG